MRLNQLKLDCIGGATTFLTMGYIIVVNPAIMKDAGIPFSASLTATVLTAASMTILMGIYARLPFAVAPGMGVNAFITYTLCLGQGMPWQHALGITFWAGVVFLFLSFFQVREAIAKAMPVHLRTAAAAGIGFFLLFLGLKAAKFITANDVTYVTRAPVTEEMVLSSIGLLVIVLLLIRNNPFAMFCGILTVTVLAALRGKILIPEVVTSAPDFSAVGQLDLMGSLKFAYLGPLLAILFTDMFDSLSTFCGVAAATGLVDKDGHPKRLREGLVTDAIATMAGALLGTSPGSTYVESTAGIKAGARTGLASVVTGLLFIPFVFVGPLVGMIPEYATAPVLVVVGVLMIGTFTDLKDQKGELPLENLIPAGLTLATIPLTFSITQGVTVGILAHSICYIAAGRYRDVHWVMYILSAVSAWILSM